MKSYTSTAATVLSALVAGAYAQDNSNSLIPTGISASCSQYLAVLDTSDDISACLTSLVDATSAFNPTTGSSTSDADLTTAINALCSDKNKCANVNLRGHLSSLYTACQSDLVGESPNEQVTTMYDLLYVLTPLRDAVCAKNEAGKFCVQEITVQGSTPQPGAAKSLVASSGSGPVVSPETLAILNKGFWTVYDNDDYSYLGIYKRQDNEQGQTDGQNNGQTDGQNNGQDNGQNNGQNNGEQAANNGNKDNLTHALVPDTEVYRTTSLIYLFVNPDLDAAQLCTPCTTAVLTPYIKFESATPYAMGLSNSPILGDQLTLWKSVTEKCGQEFSQTIMTAAGIRPDPNNPDLRAAASKTGVVTGMLGFATAILTAFML